MTMPRQRYKVIGHYVTAKTMTENGPMVVGLHTGAILPDDVTPATIAHLLSVRLIAPVSRPQPAPVPAEAPEDEESVIEVGADDSEPDPAPPAAGTDGPPVGDVETRRAAARAKLPADGSPPTRRHGQQVWAEYAVNRGYDRTTVEAASKDELIALFETPAPEGEGSG